MAMAARRGLLKASPLLREQRVFVQLESWFSMDEFPLAMKDMKLSHTHDFILHPVIFGG